MNKPRVLFLCTGNSVRSQMAEAILRKHAGDRFDVYSAGLEPKGIHPNTYRVMAEIGCELTDQWSKSLDEYIGKGGFSYLITLCGDAEERCPFFPGMGIRLHWPFEDPAAFGGPPDERLEKFRQVRDQIDDQVRTWLAAQGIHVQSTDRTISG